MFSVPCMLEAAAHSPSASHAAFPVEYASPFQPAQYCPVGEIRRFTGEERVSESKQLAWPGRRGVGDPSGVRLVSHLDVPRPGGVGSGSTAGQLADYQNFHAGGGMDPFRKLGYFTWFEGLMSRVLLGSAHD